MSLTLVSAGATAGVDGKTVLQALQHPKDTGAIAVKGLGGSGELISIVFGQVDIVPDRDGGSRRTGNSNGELARGGCCTQEVQSGPLDQIVTRVPFLVRVWQDDKQPGNRIFIELIVLDKDCFDVLLRDNDSINGLLLHPVDLLVTLLGCSELSYYALVPLLCIGLFLKQLNESL